MKARSVPLPIGILLIVLVVPGGPASAQDQPTGAIRGSVYDTDFDIPLARARVTVIELQLTTQTDENGTFLLDGLPPGTYTLTFAKGGFERQVISEVIVTSGGLADVHVDMVSEYVEMEELVVTADDPLASNEVGALEIRAEALSVQDSISKELMKKAGAGDVSGALKLVVGASVVGGKYATVRGLSDRYTGTTLNGVRLPSADPRRRAVPVDLFPTGTVDSVTVTKTFTPDLQGDFTGGGVNVQTRSVPEGPITSVTAGLEYNSLATGNENFLTYAGGGVNGIGSDSDRDLPTEATRPLPTFPTFSTNPSREDIASSIAYDDLARSFTSTMGVTRQAPGSNYGASFVLGNQFRVGSGVLGALGSLTYRRKFNAYENGINNNVIVSDPDSPTALAVIRDDNRGSDELLIGFLGSLVWQPNTSDEVSLKLIENRAAEDQSRIQIEDQGGNTQEINQSLTYAERNVRSWQLSGKHDKGSLLIDWVVADNATKQDEPDVRFFRYLFDGNNGSGRMPANSTDAQNTRRIWRDLREDSNMVGANFTLPLKWATEASVKSGFLLDRSDRAFTQLSYTYTFANQFGSFFNPKVAENLSKSRFLGEGEDTILWTDVFLDPDRIGIAGNEPPAPNQLLWAAIPLGNDVNYDGTQQIDAIYAMADLPATRKLRFTFGARFETTQLSIDPYNLQFGLVEIIEVLPSGDRAVVRVPEEQATATIDDSALLPSISLLYQIKNNMNFRASWSKTIARPTQRELAPVATEEFLFGDEFFGNPDLVLSDITNYDLRWEWFPGAGKVLATSVFHKDIIEPIEFISFAASNRSFIQPVNFPAGTVTGYELEGRTSFEFWGDTGRMFNLGANFTLIDSEVEVPLSEQESLESFGLAEESRRLQGQPEYLANVNLVYDNNRIGTQVGLFYNLVGPTLLTGAARGNEDGTPNVFEREFAFLDLTVSQRISKIFTVNFRARNLLQQQQGSDYITPDGISAVKTERDTAFRAAIAFSFNF